MAWLSPRTWVAGAVVTAAQMNEIRDNLKEIGDPWEEYTPIWATTGTNPSIGNGSLTGASIVAGKLVHVRISLTAGSTTTFGSGSWSFGLPVPSLSLRWALQGTAFDSSAGSFYSLQTFASLASGTTLSVACDPSTAGGNLRGVSASSPMTWATGDTLLLHGTYEAA